MKENGAKCSVFSIFMSFCYEQMKPLAVHLYSFGFRLSILHPLCYALFRTKRNNTERTKRIYSDCAFFLIWCFARRGFGLFCCAVSDLYNVGTGVLDGP